MAEFVFETEKGKRENQEDFYGNWQDEFFVVADGLGGHAAGEVASKIAVATAILIFKETKDIKRVFEEVNQAVLRESQKNTQYTGMGTTMVALALQQNGVVFGNVGDSRGYILSGGKLSQITKDDRDEIGFLIRALGIDKETKPRIIKESLKKGDVILLCTDGLTDFVSDKVIEKILLSDAGLKKKAEGLIEAAAQFGSTDNITVGLVTALL